jgi:viologen exporter family transport system permease protein
VAESPGPFYARGELATRAALYRRLLASQVRGQASYRLSFALDLVANGIVPAIELLSILAIFHVTRTLGGFGTAQVLTMYGLAVTSFAIADLCVGNIERLDLYVRRGLLDAVLVRPMSVLGQLLALDFSPRRVARVVVAATILVLALQRSGVTATPAHAALVISTVASGAVFFSAMFVTTATVAFWWIDSGELASAFTYGGRDFTTYPITVYSGLFRALFAYGVGFAFVAYTPAVALFGIADPTGLPRWLGWWGTPLAAVVGVALTGLIWRTGVRHYRSTGS